MRILSVLKRVYFFDNLQIFQIIYKMYILIYRKNYEIIEKKNALI